MMDRRRVPRSGRHGRAYLDSTDIDLGLIRVPLLLRLSSRHASSVVGVEGSEDGVQGFFVVNGG